MKNFRKITSAESTFYCTKCGKASYPIARIRGKERPAGHLKHMYCIYCKEDRNMVETKAWTYYDVEDFKFEFENGNFDKEGNRIMSYDLFKQLKKRGI